jgi:hypothetical protein
LEVGNFLDAVTNKITVAARYEYEPEFNFRLGQSGTNLDWIGAVISSGDDGNYNGKILFKTANAGRDTPTTKMVIKASGNVGIGTTSPTQKLHVSGGDGIINNAFIGEVPTYTSANAQFSHTSRAGAGEYSFLSANDGETFINSKTGTNIRFRVNNADQAIITSAGNVGIGTTSPAAVAGYVAETIDGTNGSFTEYRQNGTALFRIGADSSRPFLYGMTSAHMDFYTTTAQRMRITNDGNILLGTNQSYTRLTVSNGNNTRTGVTLSDADTSSLMLFAGASTIASINFDTYGLRFMGGSTAGVDNGTEIMRFTTSYNVGIGTTSPAYKLDVSGDIRSTTINLNTQGVNVSSYGFLSQTLSGQMTFLGHNVRASSTVNNTAVVVNGGWISSLIKQYYSEGITFHTSTTEYSAGATYPLADTERMRITSAGNVGIGTTSPSQALHVSGSARVTGAYYDSSNSAGSSGQVLSSTGSGTAWVNQGEATATSLYDLLPAARVAYNWVGQVVNDSWTTVFSKSSNLLTTGTWMVKMYVSDFATGGGHYTYTYSGMFTWYQDTTNQGGEQAASEIYLHRMGHAANASVLYLRTTETTAASSGDGLFQIKGNYSNTANQTIQFQFVKIF